MHIRNDARRRYEFDLGLFSPRGPVALADLSTAEAVSVTINAQRDTARFPEAAVSTGDLYATGLIEEASRLVIEAYVARVAPDSFELALEYLRDTLGADPTEEVLVGFIDDFSPPSVDTGEVDPMVYLDGALAGTQNRHATLEDLILLHLSNGNPAQERFRDLFDDSKLATETAYEATVDGLDAFFRRLPGIGGAPSLLTVLRQPALASPTSIRGQLQYIIANWAEIIGDAFGTMIDRLLRALDVIEEETKSGGLGAGPAAILDPAAFSGREEYERFSADSDWMPRVVLVAKSTYVWLDQLAARYGREVARLDQIPVESLDELAEAGFTGLWLIGIWERSEASRVIKQMRGDHDAVASAYALRDYTVADDLGGEAAFEWLRDRAWERGIRLASDMVPNHVGIDGTWVMEHPEWFVGVDEPPYPSYRFEGADLSSHPEVSVHIEDHYWDGTDAAVVFKRYDHRTGETRYLYHGNDGTAMPWNDTAQLDYLIPEVREQVIRTILDVARRSPIIRFDAAMTLAKQHIQRLWYPAPGTGGAIPSRSAHGLTDAEFDRLMPSEFWRDVVDRVAAEVPDTLLLAEAFWMMEGYFVRTLGMHRVYNSAFMHMLSAEDNAEFRSLVKNVVEFDPEILKRFVNFMNNPDEETAATQFGTGDKYFGVATVMATLPGLPMFGHGQVEGLTEKYGMEYRRARTDEQPNQDVVARHRTEISPLLHRRDQFAHVDDFLFLGLVDEGGAVQEDVIAYSNRREGEASLVIYHNRFAETAGTIHTAVPSMLRRGEAREVTTRSVAEGLDLRAADGDLVTFRDQVTGLEYLKSSRDIARHGLFVRLGAYQRHVFLDFREIHDADELHHDLARRLGSDGVPDIADALAMLSLEPLHQAMTAVADSATADAASAALSAAGVAAADEDAATVAGAASRTGRSPGDTLLVRTRRRFAESVEHHGDIGFVLAMARAAAAMDVHESAVAGWRVTDFLRGRLVAQGRPGWPADLFPVAFRHGEWTTLLNGADPAVGASDLLALLLADQTVRSFLGIHRYDGVEWFQKEAFERLTGMLLIAALDRAPSKAAVKRAAAILEEVARAGERSGWRVDGLDDEPGPADRRPPRKGVDGD